MNDLWELAKRMEQEGREYYLKLAKEEKNTILRGIYSFLAEEETRHYEYFVSLQNSSDTAGAYERSDGLSRVKEIFRSMAPTFDNRVNVLDAAEIYKRASSFEEKSVELYQKMMQQTTEPDQKAVLQSIIHEEQDHQKILNALYDFVKRPDQWVENAEFNHLEQY